MSASNRPAMVGVAIGFILVATSLALFSMFGSDGDATATAATATEADGSVATAGNTSPAEGSAAGGSDSSVEQGSTSVAEGSSSTATETTDRVVNAWVDRRTVGQRWGTSEVQGVLMFRGNPTNTWYGSGPIPTEPEIKWRFPEAPMCSESVDLGVTYTWCGNGWTGQPIVWEHDGITELMFGAYDRKFHFVDAETGLATRKPIVTGDLVKGSATLDPDGFPLVYFGSRDNILRAVALDRTDPVVIWEAVNDLSVEGRWNDDWDSNPRIVNGYLFEGSENSFYYIWRLNRSYNSAGEVIIAPELVFKMPTWNDDLMSKIVPCDAGDPVICEATSVENSSALFEGRVYFANSGGRVIGLDISGLDEGVEPTIVFDYWVGDDSDASIVIDSEGMLYVSTEWERYTDRARELGQLIKLDPYTDGDPYVWGQFSLADPPAKGGYWATPALGDGVLYAVTHKGSLVVVDQETGEEVWSLFMAPGSWSSPAVVDDDLIVVANDGIVRDFDITDPRKPELKWSFEVGEFDIEATPAIWKGVIYLASRDGFMYAIGQAHE